MLHAESRNLGDDQNHEIFDLLRRSREEAVPVIGAGLSLAAGGIGGKELRAALLGMGKVDDPGDEVDVYRVADLLEAKMGSQYVQEVVAKTILGGNVKATPELLALALCPSQLIVTTNYDDAVEKAVLGQRRSPVSYGVAEIDLALRQRSPGVVHVLHLHGRADAPDGIVLTRASYDAAAKDERVALALRQLASQHLLVFLGQSLGNGETDIRMHLSWATEQFQRQPHLLIEGAGDAPLCDEEYEHLINLRRVRFPDPNRRCRFVARVACAIGGPPVVDSDEQLPVIQGLARVYVPVPVELATEVEHDAAGSAPFSGSRFGKPATYPVDLATEARLLIIGGPGFGKTQVLLQMASKSDRPSLYIRLGAVKPILDGQDPNSVFLNWSSSAEAGHDGVRRLTASALDEQVWDFYLDGLDEVHADLRVAVAASINQFVDAFPQHRWVVASRRLTNLQDLRLTGFTHYDLVPTWDWVFQLGCHHGLKQEQLAEVIDQLPGVGSLAEIPFYGAAIVAAIVDGHTLPDTPLDLGLYLADKGFDREEPQLLQPKDEVRTWLNRLAFAMEVLGETDLARSCISDDLDDLDRIVERTLLVDAAGMVRFPANVVQEARAAHILRSPPAGQEMMRRVALEEVDGRTYIRPSWRHTIELLLASTSDSSWREAIGTIDPLVAARSVSAKADPAERQAAAAVIWNWYDTTGLHLPARLDGQLRDDLDAFELLVWDGIEDQLRSRIVSALSSDDPPRRGNAIVALAAGSFEELENRLGVFVTDTDPVVRRRAAEAAVKAKMDWLAPTLADQAARDPDDLARRTLASASIRLATDTAAVLDRLPTALRHHVVGDLNERWSRTKQLTYLANSGDGDEDWFRLLAASSPPEWSEDEVKLLAAVWSHLEFDDLNERARTVLLQHPKVALRVRLETGNTPYEFALLFLLDPLNDADLDELVEEATDPGRQLLDHYRERRRLMREPGPEMSPFLPTLSAPVGAPNPVDPTPGVVDDELFHRSPRHNEVDELDPVTREAIKGRLERLWAESREVGKSPAHGIKRTPDGWSSSESVWTLLEWAGELQLSLSGDEWLAIAGASLPPRHTNWLHVVWLPGYAVLIADAMAECDPSELRGLVVAVPNPWPSEIANAATRRFGPSLDPEVQKVILRALVTGGYESLVRGLAASTPSDLLDSVLVELGDCEAETRLLRQHLQEGSPIPDHWESIGYWLTHLACESSAEFLTEAVRDHLIRGTEPHELRLHLAALERVLGEKTVGHYEAIINDAALPNARWLWFRLQEFVDRFGEQRARSRLPTTVGDCLALLD